MIQSNYHIVFVVVIMLLSRSVYLSLKLSHNFYPASDEVVAMYWPRLGCPSVPPSVCPHCVSRADLRSPWVDLFHIAHTHPLGCVDVPFGISEV